MVYEWQAALATLAGVVALTVVGKYLAFQVPAIRRMRDYNLEQDKLTLSQKPKYRPVIKSGQRLGLLMNMAFFLAIVPFVTVLQWQPLWLMAVHLVAILMVNDFFYYLTHRFLFHGQGRFRQIHALHHQARNPTHIDAHYVHPVETGIGLAIFMATVAVLGVVFGPFHAVTLALAFVIFVQINTINHAYVDLPFFPFKTVNWMVKKHHIHHINMHKGNYGKITMLYDRMFGTLD